LIKIKARRSLDQLGVDQKALWNRQAERPRSYGIHNQIEFGRELDRQIGRSRTAENTVDMVSAITEWPRQIRPA
jgi:hypothetical protein